MRIGDTTKCSPSPKNPILSKPRTSVIIKLISEKRITVVAGMTFTLFFYPCAAYSEAWSSPDSGPQRAA
jgi:hypothetical protein